MDLKPPRYLLREYVVLRQMRKYPRGRFLELGYGTGDMLVSLARLGYHGVGYDSSRYARAEAEATLAKQGVTQVQLADCMPKGEIFAYVLLFELIGYIENPVAWLCELGKLMQESSLLIYSFTNSKHAGIAEKNSGDMACFSRDDMRRILAAGGFEPLHIINYGYPLSNLLRPLLNRHYRRRVVTDGKTEEVARSGLQYRHAFRGLTGMVVNRFTLWPFDLLQRAFSGSDLGTGYIVIARKRQ